MCSGPPNAQSDFSSCLFPILDHGFGVVSWNARGLMHSDRALRRLKFRELAVLARRFPIIALQEVHGEGCTLLLEEHGLLRTHVFLPSHCTDNNGVVKSDTGGVAFLANKGLSVKNDEGVLSPLGLLPLQFLPDLISCGCSWAGYPYAILGCQGD